MNSVVFASISNKNGRGCIRIRKKENQRSGKSKRSFKENTKEWIEADKEAVNIREELRAQFELRNSYEDLRERLGEWGEDKQWEAQEEMKRRGEVERECPTISEDGGNLDIKKVDIWIQIPR